MRYLETPPSLSSTVDSVFTVVRYFQALAKGEVPPVKTRLEQPLESVDERLGGVTKGTLAVLNNQVGIF